MMAGLHFQVLTEGMYLGMNALIQSKETSQSVNLRCSQSDRSLRKPCVEDETKQLLMRCDTVYMCCRESDAKAMHRSVLFSLDRDDFLNLLSQFPEYESQMMQDLAIAQKTRQTVSKHLSARSPNRRNSMAVVRRRPDEDEESTSPSTSPSRVGNVSFQAAQALHNIAARHEALSPEHEEV
jgi:CRP-like cAMP-binding protein